MNEELTVHQMFRLFDSETNGQLSAPYIQAAHEMFRVGGISLQQVEASMIYVCVDPNLCEEWEFVELLKEMDRRYYLVQNFRWEFSLLDSDMNYSDTIAEERARWFMQSVHGQNFSRQRWTDFIKQRPAHHTGVSFQEIEVELCNIPCMTNVTEELEREKQKREEETRLKNQKKEEKKRMREKLESDRRRLQEEQQRLQENKKMELQKKIEETQSNENEKEARKLAEERRMMDEEKERRRLAKEKEDEKSQSEQMMDKLNREEEEKRRKLEDSINMAATAKEAANLEKEAEQLAKEAREKLQKADDAKSKRELLEVEAAAKKRQAAMKERRIRANLKVAISTRDHQLLQSSIQEFKITKLQDYDSDIPKAEDILKLLATKDGLKKAMKSRELKALEEAIKNVIGGGFETELQRELIEANNVLLRLRRLERIRAEILELKQSTVAEIRSYQNPPAIVHSVMIATFIVLGHREKECKEWKKVQALVGKTGKEGLKRRCLEYDPSTLAKQIDIAEKADIKLAKFELDDVRDVSAGAATFYLWATNMIEEAKMISEQND